MDLLFGELTHHVSERTDCYWLHDCPVTITLQPTAGDVGKNLPKNLLPQNGVIRITRGQLCGSFKSDEIHIRLKRGMHGRGRLSILRYSDIETITDAAGNVLWRSNAN